MGRAITRRGLMLVLSSPSGAGKSSIARALKERDPGLVVSISATTRPRRPNELEGRDYQFVDKPAFERMVAEGRFIEHATVFDHRYGTPKAPVIEAIEAGRDVLFDVDWQGTRQLAKAARDDLVTVFVLPPSADELHRRLQTRATDSAEVIQGRMRMAAGELTHYSEYDYLVVNHDLAAAIAEVEAILVAERLRAQRLPGAVEFVRELKAGL